MLFMVIRAQTKNGKKWQSARGVPYLDRKILLIDMNVVVVRSENDCIAGRAYLSMRSPPFDCDRRRQQ
jgi:hypothetical protein